MSGSLTIRNNTTQLAISGNSPTVTVAVAVPGPAGEGAGGTVTSVAVAVPTGLEVSGSPVTESGTITISYSTGYALPTIAAVTDGTTAFGWGNHAGAGYLTSSAAALAYQPLAAVLTGTTASFTTADETKLDHISVTQAVDLDAIETRVNALDAAVVLKGVWDASAGTFPGSGAAQAGDSWIVSVAGTVDSVAFAVGDRAIAITDNASPGTFVANWFKADYTDQVLSVCGRTGAVTIASTDITDSTTAGRAILTAADAAAQRTAMGVTSVDLASPGTIGGTTPGVVNATLFYGNNTAASTDIFAAYSGASKYFHFTSWAELWMSTAGAGLKIGSTVGLGTEYWLQNAGLYIHGGNPVAWGAGSASGVIDTGVGRNAGGVVEANNGTLGTLRDFKGRNLIATGYVKTEPVTVGTLGSASAAGFGARSAVTDANTTHLAGLGTTVAAGGSNKVPVYSDGTNWIIG